MILHYLKKKENIHKKKALNIYSKIINQIDNFTNKSNFFLKKEFNTTFELTILLIFIVFFVSKKQNSEINQEIMNLLVKDLDYSFRKFGVSDMSIGKYVKKYVKKTYYRFKILDKIFKNNEFKKFNDFVIKLNILESKTQENEFSEYLYEIIKANLIRLEFYANTKELRCF